MIRKLLCVLFFSCVLAQQQFDPRFQDPSQAGRQPPQGFQQGIPQQHPGQPQGPPPPPRINWGKCPQLEPEDEEKRTKANLIKACLEATPLPENITQETVERHRTQVAKCALEKENWFSEDGGYRYEKAETEIKSKNLPADIEPQILRQHNECRKEAQEQFPSLEAIIGQVQLYQACMDYHISLICEIQIMAPQFGPQGGPPPQGNNRQQ